MVSWLFSLLRVLPLDHFSSFLSSLLSPLHFSLPLIRHPLLCFTCSSSPFVLFEPLSLFLLSPPSPFLPTLHPLFFSLLFSSFLPTSSPLPSFPFLPRPLPCPLFLSSLALSPARVSSAEDAACHRRAPCVLTRAGERAAHAQMLNGNYLWCAQR